MKTIFKVAIISVFMLTFAVGMSSAEMPEQAIENDNDGITNTASQNAAATTVIGDIGSNNKSAEPKRYFAPPGEVTYPIAPNIFQQQPEETYQTKMKIRDMLEYDEDGLTTQAQMNILASSKSDKKRIMVRSRVKVSEVTDEDRIPLDVPMAVAFEKVQGMRKIATINVLSDSKGSISDDVFAQVQVEAWKLGGQMMHVKAEGFQRMVRNKGAGIGFTWSGSVISGGQMSSTTGVMGAGVTWGDAGLFDHPFIIVNVLVAK